MAVFIRKHLILAIGLALSPAALPAQPAAKTDGLADLPPDIVAMLTGQSAWSASATLHGGVGYKENLLLSRYDSQASGFARGGIETFLWRLPQGRVDAYAFINAEGTRYFSPGPVDHEAQAFLQGEWRYRIAEKFKFALSAQGYYLDQVFDVSDTEVQRSVAQLKVTGLAVGPNVHWAFVPWAWVETRGAGKRETYRDGLNNNRFFEGEMRLGWRPGARFEASAGYFERWRDYDRREQYSEGGRPLAGTALRIFEREAELKIGATLDKAARWKTVTRTGGVDYADNGSGYFSYREAKFSQKLEWAAGPWLVRLEGSAKRLVYDVQTVGLGVAPPARLKENSTVELRAERKLSARWTVYAEWNWERNRSNYELASYRTNECLLGAQWSWEK